MKQLIAVVCVMLAASPLALAQDKGKDAEKKSPAAMERSASPDTSKAKAAEKKSAMPAEKSAKAGKPKKERTDKQKAQDAKMKACNKEARDKKMKGDARTTFLSSCMGGDAGRKDEKSGKGETKSAK